MDSLWIPLLWIGYLCFDCMSDVVLDDGTRYTIFIINFSFSKNPINNLFLLQLIYSKMITSKVNPLLTYCWSLFLYIELLSLTNTTLSLDFLDILFVLMLFRFSYIAIDIFIKVQKLLWMEENIKICLCFVLKIIDFCMFGRI